MAATKVSGAWSYAVPLEESEADARSYLPQVEAREMPGRVVPRRPSVWELQPDTETTNARRASTRAENMAVASRKRSRNALRDNYGSSDTPKREPGTDDSAWIHRDKLAQIEIKEMEEAGIHVRQSRRSDSTGAAAGASRRSSRSASRSAPRRRMSHDRHNGMVNEEDYPAAYPGYDEMGRKRVSTVPSQGDDEPSFNSNIDTEFRTPEELAKERFDQAQRIVRPSTSRIPISKGSAVPLPSQVLGRDSPLPRSRAGSGAWPTSWDELQHGRRGRNGSVSSQVLLDDPNFMQTTPPGSSNKTSSTGENSPPKSRVPRKAIPSARKGQAADATVLRPPSSHQDKARSTSAARPPGSSAGHKARPSTGHGNPPQGEAPWIAGMYKPDPSLPPEKQLLPTHAKRIAQEQWEKEGKTGTVYDRECRLLNDDEFQKPTKPPALVLDKNRLDLDHTNGKLTPKISPGLEVPSYAGVSPAKSTSSNPHAWPLTPRSDAGRSDAGRSDAGKSDARSETASVRPGTSGGYKITPTIPSMATIERPLTSPAPQQNHTPRLPELDEKDEPKPKKGCCCVVM